MSAALLLLLALAFPVVGAGLAAVRGPRRWSGALAAVAAAPAVALAVLVGPAPSLEVELSWLLLGSRLGLDATAWPLFLSASLLWLAAGVYTGGYLAEDARQRRFLALFLAAMAGNLWLVASRDVATFYTAYAVMSFSTYGLVVHPGGAEAERAGRVYLVMVILSEVLVLCGLALAVAAAGGAMGVREVAAAVAGSRAESLTLGLLLAGFGVKVGVLGLHTWLPLAHSLAPTPASAVLSGAMLKAGLLGWLRVLPEVPRPGWGALLVALGLAAALAGALLGCTQRRPKAVLAYSSVSQMGFLTVGVGLLLRGEAGAAGAVLLYAVHHALAKGALFLGVGVAQAASGPARRWVLGGLALLGLSIAGAPLTGGALAKAALKGAGAGPGLTLALSLAAVGSTLVIARFLHLMAAPEAGAHVHGGARLWGPWAALGVLAFGSVWALAPGAAVGKVLSAGGAWTALWPVLLGAGVAGLALRGSQHTGRKLPEVPTGDLAVLAVRASAAVRVAEEERRAARELARARKKGLARTARRARRRTTAPWLVRLESRLGRWSALELALLGLVGLYVFLLTAA
jgi:formate hydrogenlyase subunit 3/multisubunit Na+/H+ antiporter MnhD subunit